MIIGLTIALSTAAVRAVEIDSVSISRPFFNPTIGQTIAVSFVVPKAGLLTVDVLAPDGSVARRLGPGRNVRAGKTTLSWDGRDRDGKVVSDEAYSVQIQLKSGGSVLRYSPASRELPMSSVNRSSYDRESGTLSYELAKPSRVRISAGIASSDGKELLPVMKVVANDVPRTLGSVMEHWNGLDETGTVFIPDQPGFAVTIEATELPENAIITVGNRRPHPPPAATKPESGR